MGHLINSRSTRLGWFSGWWDQWFIKNSYYTELLYSCFRIRYFLIYFFFSKSIMIKFVLFYGHFEIIKVSKFLLIKLFYYDGLLEELIDDCLDFFGQEYRDGRRALRKRSNLQFVMEKSDRNFLLQTRMIKCALKMYYVIRVKSLINQLDILC